MFRHPDYETEFATFWRDHQADFADINLHLRPCKKEPSESYGDGSDLITEIVQRMPGFQQAVAAAAAAAPQVQIFCNKVAASASDNERTSRPDLAYCGYTSQVRYRQLLLVL